MLKSFLLVLSLHLFLSSAFQYPFSLPALPYETNALEPVIKAEFLNLHHTAHHQGYTNNLNAAMKNLIEQQPEFQEKTIVQILSNLDAINDGSVRTAITNNGGGFYNHWFFWNSMSSSSVKEPTGLLKHAIDSRFGSVEEFKAAFGGAAKSLFGSGWAWLVYSPETGLLDVVTTVNQVSPYAEGQIPLLTLDVWEHAYYLQYRNKRVSYVEEWFSLLNWDFVAANFQDAVSKQAKEDL